MSKSSVKVHATAQSAELLTIRLAMGPFCMQVYSVTARNFQCSKQMLKEGEVKTFSPTFSLLELPSTSANNLCSRSSFSVTRSSSLPTAMSRGGRECTVSVSATKRSNQARGGISNTDYAWFPCCMSSSATHGSVTDLL